MTGHGLLSIYGSRCIVAAVYMNNDCYINIIFLSELIAVVDYCFSPPG